MSIADIEQQITSHQEVIADLRNQALTSPEFSAMSGREALRWLTSRGATDAEARKLIVQVIMANRAANNR